MRRWILPCLLFFACRGEPTEVLLPGPNDADTLAFVVQIRGGRPLEIWRGDQLDSGPIQATGDDDDQFVFVKIPRASVASIDPLLEPTLIDALELKATVACAGCDGICLEERATLLSLGLPADTEYLELLDGSLEKASDATARSLSSQIRLETRRVLGDCVWGRGKQPELFAAADFRLPSADEAVYILDEDRVLISNPTRLMLILRGRGQADNARRVLSPSSLSHEAIGGAALISSTSTVARLLVISRFRGNSGPQGSAIFEVEAGEEGFRVLRERFRTGEVLSGILPTEAGGFVAVGLRGAVVTSRAGETPETYSLGENLRLDVVRYLGEALRSFYVGGNHGLVAEGDLFAGPLGVGLTGLERSGGLVDSSVREFAVRTRGAETEVWAFTRGQGAFRRLEPGRWRAESIEAPPGADVCSTMPNACGRASLIEISEGIDFGVDGRLFYAPWKCSTFYTHAEGEPCTQSFDFSEVGLADGTVSFLSRHENRLYFVRDLQIWSLEL